MTDLSVAALGLGATALGRIGSQGRQINNMIAVAGDSRMDFGKSITAPTIYAHTVKGIQFWTATLSGARVQFPLEYDFAVAGTTSAHLATVQLPQIIACPASAVTILCSTNDVTGGLTLAQTISNFTTVLNALSGAGKLVFLFSEMPRTGSTLTSAQRSQLMANRRWLKNAPSIWGNVIEVDCWPEMSNPGVTTIDSRTSPLVMRVGDNLHPGPAGAYYAGKALATKINAIYPAWDRLAYSNADQFSAVNSNLFGVINENPVMTGASGAITGGTGTLSGNVADNYNLNSSTASGVTATMSKVADPTGQITTQRIVLSGTPSSTNADIILEQTGSTMLGRVSAGDTLEMFVSLSCAASVNLKTIMAQVKVVVDGVSYYGREGSSDTGANFCAPEAWSGTIKTPRITIPSGTLTEVRIGLYMSGYSSNPITADINVNGMNLLKVF